MSGRKIIAKGASADGLDTTRLTQAERRETAERAILEAAMTIVAERGLDALTLHEVGEAAGYSRALPGHYFGTKSALLSALADHIVAIYNDRVNKAVAPAQTLQQFCDYIALSFEDIRRHPETARAYQSILAGSLHRRELVPIVERLNQAGIDALVSAIKLLRDNGEVRSDVRPRIEASIILASLRGVTFHWLTKPDPVFLSRMREALTTNIRRSLAP